MTYGFLTISVIIFAMAESVSGYSNTLC